ncbi:hypothetical protein JY651_18960 [Pyxidicoccus parkwayensis]|uniref:DUF4166 domain-containing protein n=1 Tax=Pyxidicoccus parkwayensis TaxID=2813578 RepID=A0ABX7P8X1_9BACT|nr:DUF6544 family protein [Pyxidicoccus parkwaysis]QSQ26865.1 hypothetical protein JY651_18960 [Pyxidicoccus parkwaysis]
MDGALTELPPPTPSLSRDEDAVARRLVDTPPRGSFRPELVEGLPPPARDWLMHAIAVGTPLWRTTRLLMHGSIKVGERWLPFEAMQIHAPGKGMLWKARARMMGLPIVGHDLYAEGRGEMRWKMLGLVPVARGEGPDIDRSTRGRLAAETAVMVPTWLVGPHVTWTGEGPRAAVAHFTIDGEPFDIRLQLGDGGALRGVSFLRWGAPLPGDAFGLHPFGCEVQEEQTVAGLTVPRRMRAGWFFGGPRFESEGEFFRATVDSLRPL